jgi:exodeoxyribonuclease V alpha subunit
MLFPHGHGVTTSKAVRIYKTYGDQAIGKVKNNPYVLAVRLTEVFRQAAGSHR